MCESGPLSVFSEIPAPRLAPTPELHQFQNKPHHWLPRSQLPPKSCILLNTGQKSKHSRFPLRGKQGVTGAIRSGVQHQETIRRFPLRGKRGGHNRDRFPLRGKRGLAGAFPSRVRHPASDVIRCAENVGVTASAVFRFAENGVSASSSLASLTPAQSSVLHRT